MKPEAVALECQLACSIVMAHDEKGLGVLHGAAARPTEKSSPARHLSLDGVLPPAERRASDQDRRDGKHGGNDRGQRAGNGALLYDDSLALRWLVAEIDRSRDTGTDRFAMLRAPLPKADAVDRHPSVVGESQHVAVAA